MSRGRWMDPFHVALKMTDPLRWIALHRRLVIQRAARCGKALKVTHRAEVLNHAGERDRCVLGNYVTLDGTLEVYDRGLLKIGDHAFVGRSRIYASERVEIGRFCLVSDGAAIMDSDLHAMTARVREEAALKWAQGVFPDVYEDVRSAPVRLGNHSWVGFGAVITKGVEVGEGVIVGAGSVVTKSVPPWTIVAGNPARVVRELPSDAR